MRWYAFDWQAASRGKGAVDVAYFISLSFATESRHRLEGQLLADYHDSLVELGVDNYSFDEFGVDVRIGVFRLHQIVAATIVDLEEQLFATDEAIQLVRTVCGRLQTLLDWNCDEVIPR